MAVLCHVWPRCFYIDGICQENYKEAWAIPYSSPFSSLGKAVSDLFFIIARVFFTFLKKKKGLHQGTQQLAYPYIRIHNLFLVLYLHAPKEQRNIFFLVILYATVQSKKKKANRPSQKFSILNHFSVSVADAPFWEETEWLLIGKKKQKKTGEEPSWHMGEVENRKALSSLETPVFWDVFLDPYLQLKHWKNYSVFGKTSMDFSQSQWNFCCKYELPPCILFFLLKHFSCLRPESWSQ